VHFYSTTRSPLPGTQVVAAAAQPLEPPGFKTDISLQRLPPETHTCSPVSPAEPSANGSASRQPSAPLPSAPRPGAGSRALASGRTAGRALACQQEARPLTRAFGIPRMMRSRTSERSRTKHPPARPPRWGAGRRKGFHVQGQGSRPRSALAPRDAASLSCLRYLR